MEADDRLDVPAKIPFHLEQAKVDGKPAVLLRSTHLNEDEIGRHTAIAIPLHANFKYGAVAIPSSNFEFNGLDPKKTWAGVQLNEQKQAYIQIAQNVVSEIHLIHTGPSHVRWALTLLSKMHDVPLLFRQGKDLDFANVNSSDSANEEIVEMDVATC
jgi:hypothetical protein